MAGGFRSIVFPLLFLAFSGVSTDRCEAQRSTLSRNYDAKTFIRIEPLFDGVVKSGYRPYLVTIRNGRDRTITWTIQIDSNHSGGGRFQYRSVFRIEVEPGAEVLEELLVHSPPTILNRYSNYRYVSVQATAPGLPSVSRGDSESFDPEWPSIGISAKLAQRNLSRLKAKKKSKRRTNDYFASSYEELPSNWRGLTCLDLLMIDDTTWKGLSKQKRRAVMTWVRFGGTVEVFSENAEEPNALGRMGFPDPDSSSHGTKVNQYGMGEVRLRSWNGADLPDSLVDGYAGLKRFDRVIDTEFGRGWKMLGQFGVKDFNPFLVLVLLVIFAVLVGPVNLFHFARAGRRHRLFITTPIISLAASLIMILIILIQDGLGGAGQRVALVDLQSDPDRRLLQITQQQISRSGVMLQSGFESREEMTLVPVKIPESRWNPLSKSRNRSSKYRFSGFDYGGDLFRSRSEQGFHIRAVRPTRSRVERRSGGEAGAAPRLFSSLEFSVSRFFYVDGAGVVWKGAPGRETGPGEEFELEASNLNELLAWLQEETETVAPTDRGRFLSLHTQRRRYFGLAENPGNLLVETHPGIRWKNDRVVVTGVSVDP